MLALASDSAVRGDGHVPAAAIDCVGLFIAIAVSKVSQTENVEQISAYNSLRRLCENTDTSSRTREAGVAISVRLLRTRLVLRTKHGSTLGVRTRLVLRTKHGSTLGVRTRLVRRTMHGSTPGVWLQ